MNRDDAIEKVRKLLALADNGAATSGEAENAARQAAAMMRKFNIEAAEAQMQDLMSDEPDLVQEMAFSSYDPGAKGPQKTLPIWVGMVAVGISSLCQVKVDGYTVNGQAGVRFSGYSTDVVFAKWLLDILCRALFKEARNQNLPSMKERGAFRVAAASHLQKRLSEMAASQDEEVHASTGTAVAVYNKKAQMIAEAFGASQIEEVQFDTNAHIEAKARDWAGRVNIPTNRPIADARPQQARIS